MTLSLILPFFSILSSPVPLLPFPPFSSHPLHNSFLFFFLSKKISVVSSHRYSSFVCCSCNLPWFLAGCVYWPSQIKNYALLYLLLYFFLLFLFLFFLPSFSPFSLSHMKTSFDLWPWFTGYALIFLTLALSEI